LKVKKFGPNPANKMSMKIQFKYLLILLLALTAGIIAGDRAFAANASVSPQEQYMLDLINQARVHPLDMAALIGKDPEQVLEDFPQKRAILEQGMRPVVLNKKIQAGTSGHASEMVTLKYYSRISADGRDVRRRMEENGYFPDAAWESLGLISFNNIVKPNDAVWALFENMLAAELDPANDGAWNILNPAFSEAGCSIDRGRFKLEGRTLNLYLAVCDFASSATDMYAAESMLWRLINRVRTNSRSEIQEILGISGNDLIDALGRRGYWKMFAGLPPLAANQKLAGIAEKQCQEIFDGRLKPDNNGIAYVPDRLDLLGDNDYSAVSAREVRIQLKLGPDSKPVEAAAQMFKRLLAAEVESGNAVNILNGSVTEMGAAIKAKPLPTGDVVYYGVLELAEPEAERMYLLGSVMAANEDGAPEIPDNNCCRIGLSRFDEETETFLPPQIAHTGPRGGYQVQIEKNGAFEIRCGDTRSGGAFHTEQFLHHTSKNRLKNLVIHAN